MCLAIPGQIVQFLPGTDLATADVSGIKRNINIGLLESEGLALGDWVLIHVGFAMSKVDEQEARASLEFLESLGQLYRDELNQFSSDGPMARPGADRGPGEQEPPCV